MTSSMAWATPLKIQSVEFPERRALYREPLSPASTRQSAGESTALILSCNNNPAILPKFLRDEAAAICFLTQRWDCPTGCVQCVVCKDRWPHSAASYWVGS